MSALFSKTPGIKPDYTSLQVQTATSTLPIPIVWGQNKVAANVIWYQNFQTHGSGGGGKGGLFSTPSTGYTYTADLIMALCEGPVTAINQIWRDQSVYTLADLGLTFFNGSTPQTVWGYLESTYPAQALAYQGTCYTCAASYQLGDAADIGNHNFEIIGILAGTGVNGIDADPAQCIYDFLTNPQYGAGFAAANINTSTLYGSSGDSSLQTYCRALGIAFSPALTDQEQGSSILARWLQIVNCAAVWSGTQLKFIPYGDASIAAGNVATTTVPIVIPTAIENATSIQIEITGASQFISDGGVVYAFSNIPLTYNSAYSVENYPPNPGEYGISPAGTYIFNVNDAGNAIQISYTYSIPYGFTPDTTPIYNLTDEDFVDDSGGADGKGGKQDPLTVQRVDPFTLPTIQRIEVYSRSNEYAATPVEARDQSQIELFGPRVGSTIQAHEICDDINIAPIVAQTILQRQLYIRAHFTFKLSWEYGLLEPMDCVILTDANLGLYNQDVRIITIEEDDNGLLTVTAEELTVNVSTPVLYPTATASTTVPNRGAPADSVNTPLIYEAPTELTGGVQQVWLAASGGAAGVVDPNWGGAYVWMSYDNSTYEQIGTISQPARQGVLTAALASASGWDTTDTLAVNLAESGGALTGTSETSAQQGATMSVVDGEILAYESATLTGTNAYNLTGLQRGLFGTTPASHASAAPFCRLDGAVIKYSLPNSLIGKTVYFKFQSFNVFGAGLEDLSSCTAYSHTMLGSGVYMPANITNFGGALTLDGATYTLAGQWTADPNSASYEVDWSLDGSTNWTVVYSGAAASFSSQGWGYIATLYLRVRGINGSFVSPEWTQITLSQGPQQTVDVVNAGLYVGFDDLQAGTPGASFSLAGLVAIQPIELADDINVAALGSILTAQNWTTLASAKLNNVEASVALAYSAIATNSLALAQYEISVAAQFADVTAAVDSGFAAQATSIAANAEAITTLSSEVGSSVATISSELATQATSLSSLAADITTLEASSGYGFASGSLEFVVVSAESGVDAAFELDVTAAGTGTTAQYAGMRIEALAGGTSQIVFESEQFIVESSTTKTVVFATNSDGTLMLQGVTKVDTTIESNATTSTGTPVLSIDFYNGIITFSA